MWYVADFETTTQEVSSNSSSVWLYAICNEDAEIVNYGTNINDFFKYIKQLKGNDIYFHNLAFDGIFILCYLFNNNFKQYERIRKKDNKGFATLIGDLGQFYQITINFARNKQVKILDSLKLIPSKVEKIAKDFGIEEHKLKIDYNNTNVDDSKLEYVFHDVIIVAKALKIVKSLGNRKMTVGSSAYNMMTTFNKNIPFMCPELDDDFLITWRKAYRGGRSQVNPLYQGKILNNVKRYDINSMYAYIQYALPMPIGYPISIQKRGMFKFELYHIKITFVLKDRHIPSLLKNGGLYSDSKYYINSNLDEELYITNIDYMLLERNYNIIHVEFLEMYGFNTTTTLFKKFIEYYYDIKNNSVGAKRGFAKSMLVNSYGKFGSKLYAKNKIPVMENGIIKFKTGEEERRKAYYLPIALAITSYAHLLLDDKIHYVGYENFVYCDTDSVHTFKHLDSKDVHPTYLGKFKLEAIEIKAKYVRQKCYVTYENEVWHITASGLPEQTKQGLIKYYKDDIINKFDIGLTIEPNNKEKIPPKLRHTNVKGGVLLLPTTFKIRG